MVKEWLCVLSREKWLKGTVVYLHRKWALMLFLTLWFSLGVAVTNGMSEAKCRILRCLCMYVFLFYPFESLIMNDSIKRLN